MILWERTGEIGENGENDLGGLAAYVWRVPLVFDCGMVTVVASRGMMKNAFLGRGVWLFFFRAPKLLTVW